MGLLRKSKGTTLLERDQHRPPIGTLRETRTEGVGAGAVGPTLSGGTIEAALLLTSVSGEAQHHHLEPQTFRSDSTFVGKDIGPRLLIQQRSSGGSVISLISGVTLTLVLREAHDEAFASPKHSVLPPPSGGLPARVLWWLSDRDRVSRDRRCRPSA
jgi:hypothetical protein